MSDTTTPGETGTCSHCGEEVYRWLTPDNAVRNADGSLHRHPVVWHMIPGSVADTTPETPR